MDTITSFAAEKNPQAKINKFAVAGASKVDAESFFMFDVTLLRAILPLCMSFFHLTKCLSPSQHETCFIPSIPHPKIIVNRLVLQVFLALEFNATKVKALLVGFSKTKFTAT